MAFLEENTYLKSLSFYSLSAVAERVGVRFGRADREIFLAAWQISEVARRNPSDERLDVMAVKRFLKLVMRKYWGLS